MDPEHKADMERMAEAAARTCSSSSGSRRELLPTNGQPIVFGRRVVDPAAPTVTVYNHMDVQPGGDARGVEDRAVPVHRRGRHAGSAAARPTTRARASPRSSARSSRSTRGARVNVNFLWELEEEIGSPSFAGGVKAHRDALKTDFVVVSDTIWVSRERPASPAGLRGLQPMRLILETGHDGPAQRSDGRRRAQPGDRALRPASRRWSTARRAR